MRGVKTDDSYKDGGFEASKTATVTRMATPRGSIPVTVGTVEAWWGVGGDTIGGAGEPRTENLHTCMDAVLVFGQLRAPPAL